MSLARELTLDAAQATRGARTSARPLDRNQMRKLLDSRNERDVLEGLRRVMAVRVLSLLEMDAPANDESCR